MDAVDQMRGDWIEACHGYISGLAPGMGGSGIGNQGQESNARGGHLQYLSGGIFQNGAQLVMASGRVAGKMVMLAVTVRGAKRDAMMKATKRGLMHRRYTEIYSLFFFGHCLSVRRALA